MTPNFLEKQSLVPANILIVDDNPANLHLLNNILKECGNKIRLVKDGKFAIESALVEPPDLILLDIIMPEVDGYEVCSQLKANPKTRNIPVIFLSAKGEVFDKVKGFSLGAVDYITKPFAAEEVVARIENHLKIWRLSQELREQNTLLQQELQELQRVEMELKNREELNRSQVNFVPLSPLGNLSISTVSSFLKPVLTETPALDTECLVLPLETTVKEVTTRMSQMRVSCALIVEKEKLVGIFTERDLVKITAENRELEDTEISQVMSSNPIAITLSVKLDFFSILSLMRQHRIRHLPVLYKLGNILGVITQSSIREVLQPIDLLKLKEVGQVMIPRVVHAPPGSSLLEITKIMTDRNISCVVIAESENGSDVFPLGIITETDIVQFRSLGVDLLSIKAEEIMSAPLLPVRVEDSLWNAHQLMSSHRIRQLVVVNEVGNLVGILTQSGLLAALEPVDMYSTLEALRQQVDKRIVKLNQANERLQQEIALREKQLREREILERELTEQNTRLEEEVRQRIVAETTLRQRERELRALVENAPDAILRLNREYRYLYVNQKFTLVLGKSRDEILGKTIRELNTIDASTAFWEEAVAAVFNTGEEREIELEMPSEGEIRFYSARLVPEWGDNDEVETVLAIVRDVSDRKRAEAILRENQRFIQQITESSPNLLYIYDVLEKRNIYTNRLAVEILGYSSEEIVNMGEDLLPTIMHPEDLAEVPAKFEQISRLKGGENFEHEYRLLDVRGEWRTFMVRELAFARTEEGELWQILGTAIDISDRKRAEEETKLLLRANQAIHETANVESAIQAILNLICRTIDWDWGEAWLPSKNKTFLQLSGVWYGTNALKEFQNISENITFASGEGLPGRVWSNGQSEWLEGVDKISPGIFLRTRVAAEVNIKTGLGVPVVADGRVVAVLVFFKDTPLPHEPQLIQLVEAIASQLGRTIETKEAQQALRLGEERLELAIEGSELGIWDWQIETGECYFSFQWKKMLGYDDEEIENNYQSWERLVCPEDLPRTKAVLNACLQQETETYEAEVRMRSRSGEWKWILIHGKIVEWNSEGKPLRMAGTHKDISHRKQAELSLERLLESEQLAKEEAEAARIRATDILESIGDAFFALDGDWKFTYVNRQAELVLQRKRSELMGQSLWAKFPETLGSRFEGEYRRVVSQQVKTEFVEFYPPLDAWFEVRAFPAKEGVLVYFQDVSDRVAAETALRNSEHFLRSIYEGVETAIFIVDVTDDGDFRYVGLNPAHERMSGIKDSDLKGKTPEEVLPPAAAKQVRDRYNACLGARERIEYEECLPFQGKDTWWITKLTPLFDSQDHIYRLIGTSFNITDRKEAELALAGQIRREKLVTIIQERIRSSLNLEEILITATEEIRRFLKSDRVLIYQILSGNVRIAIIESVAPGLTPICDLLFPEEVFPQENYDLYSQGEIFVVEDINQAQISPGQAQFLQESGIKAKLGIPILKKGELWGLIAVHQCQQVRTWEAVELESLKQIAVQLAIGIQQSTLYEQAQTEIKEREAAEIALRKSQRFVQHIADTSPNLLYIFDLEGQRNIYSNREIAEFLGYTPKEIREMGNNLLPRIIHPHDLAKLPEHFQKFETAKDGEILELEYRVINAKGEWRYFLGRETVFARTPDGKTKQILGTASDITTLKETEAALREAAEREKTLALAFQRMRQSLEIDTIFEATTEELRSALHCSRVGIYRFDADYSGEFVAESVAGEEIPLMPKSESTQRLALNSEPPVDCRVQTLLQSPQTWQDSYLKETQGGNLNSADTYCLVINDIYEANFNNCYLERLEEFNIKAYIIVPIFCGAKLWGLLAAYENYAPRNWKSTEINIALEIGNQLGVALQQAELLEQTQKQSEALERAAVAADAANRAKSEFLASMSHELRTPLNAILGFTQLMNRDRSLSAEHKEQLKTINRAGEHLLALINDILEMSKIEAGRTTLNESCFNLTSMLESLESMLRLKAQSKGLQLIFDLAPELPPVIKADEGKLRQVLINILGNAIKFTKSGGVNLRAKVGTSEPSTCQLLFEIEDTGPGIAPEEIGNLFEAFGQTQTGRESQQGTGLGLPISRKFLQLMGGEIEVSSTVGKGSIFSFELRVTVVSSKELLDSPFQGRAIALADATVKHRILVVDDLSNNRQFLLLLLRTIGFEVRDAENGEEGLRLWSSWEPHLILMDMRMPVMDGYEATKQIKATQQGQNTIVIALTASAFEEDRQRILAAGCNDFVGKPFREEVLLEKIGEHLKIKYIYEREDEESQESTQTFQQVVTTSDIIQYLSEMPAEWVAEVHLAASQGTDDLILELLEQVPSQLSPLASALGDLANNFQFEKIMELTK